MEIEVMDGDEIKCEIQRKTYEHNVKVVELHYLNDQFKDFVLLCFPYCFDSCEKARKITWEYKQKNNDIGVIGCPYNDNYDDDLGTTYEARFGEDFDLKCNLTNDNQFENLVRVCKSLCVTDIKLDLEDLRNIVKETESNDVWMASSFDSRYLYATEDAAKKLCGLMNRKIKRCFVAISANDENLGLFVIKAICDKLSEYMDGDYMEWQVVTDCADMHKNEIRIDLIGN